MLNLAKKSDYIETVERLTKAASDYYNGTGLEMSDSEYDSLLKAVEQAELEHPDWKIPHTLYEVSGGTGTGDVEHSVPLLSLDKCNEQAEINAWAKRVKTNDYVVSPKLDGMAISAEYENGKLVRAITRGDGQVGEEVTHKLPTDTVGLPRTIDGDVTVIVRGELIFTKEQFKEANSRRVDSGKAAFVNARNAMAGSVRRDDLPASERAPMTFFAYAVTETNMETQHEAMSELDGLGFLPAVTLMKRYAKVDPECDDMESVTKAIEAIGDNRESFPCDLDGAVVKVNSFDEQSKLGATGSHPRWAIAWKFAAEEATTTLLDIEVQVGRTGIHSLRGRLEPVFVGGTTITYATLHNPSDLEERDVRPGDTVMVRRAGDVIPEIAGHIHRPADSKPWEMPTDCIECGEALDTSEKRWRCVNRDCPAGAAALLVYACSRDALDIEGAGEAVVGTLVTEGVALNLGDLDEITADDVKNLEGFGPKSAQNLVSEIAKAKTQPLHRLVTALGIRMTGRRMSKRLAAHFGTLGTLRAASARDLCDVEGIGLVRGTTIHDEIEAMSPLLDKLTSQGWNTEDENHGKAQDAGSKPLEGEKIVVTGSVPGYGRNEVRDLIERLGAKSSSSVSKSTTLLVSSKPDSSKHAKAVELGIRVESPEWLVALTEEVEA